MKSSHAMRNSKDISYKKNLERLLESIVYILYIISNFRKSGVQCFKRCANRSWIEEVIAIWRQLHQAEKEFRITLSQMRKFRITFLWCENFTSLCFTCEIFAATFLKCENFCITFSSCKIFTTPYITCEM